MPNTAAEALEFARHEHMTNSQRWPGLCLAFVRTSFGLGSYFPSAASAWHGADHKHYTKSYKSIPRGVPVYWLGGSQGFGHIALSAGGGLCWSNDIVDYGGIDLVSMERITQSWNQSFQGWSEDLNNVNVYSNESEWASGDVYVSKLKKGVENSDSVRRLKWVLRHKSLEDGGSPQAHQNGNYGADAVRIVKKWQRRVAEKGEDDGTFVSMAQAERLFGPKYHLHAKV